MVVPSEANDPAAWPAQPISLNMAAMLEFRTRGFNPYAVKYSPYYDNRVAVASAANFGIVGNGRLFALGLTAAGIQVEKTCVPAVFRDKQQILDSCVAIADETAAASTPTTHCTTWHGPRSTRTSCLPPAVMAPSSCSTSGSTPTPS